MRQILNKTLVFTLLVTGLGLYVCPASGAQEFFRSTDPIYQKIIVMNVVSAQLIRLENGENIRLIGLKAPFARPKREKQLFDQFGFEIEPHHPSTSFSVEAFEYVRDLLEGQTVRLEFDRQKKDDNFHLFAYVYLKTNDLFVNAQIIRMGYADLQISPPNTKYADTLREAYQEARREKRGLQGQ